MDRLISEQQVLKVLDNLKANFTCYDSVTLDEVASHVKDIPSAEPYKGITNGEVIEVVFPKSVIRNEGKEVIGVILSNDNSEQFYTRDWWNSPYKGEQK